MYRFIIAVFYCVIWLGIVAPSASQAQDEANGSDTIEIGLYGPGRDIDGDGLADSFQTRFKSIGEAGRSGYIILHGTNEVLTYGEDEAVFAPRWTYPNGRWSVPLPDEAGPYHAQVCGWDREAELPTVCSPVITVPVVEGRDGLVAIYGDDPQDEVGSIAASFYGPGRDRDGDGLADSFMPRFQVTGEIGHRRGFVILHGFDQELTYENAEMTKAPYWTHPSGRWEVPLPERAGLYHSKVCGWDPFRELPTTCSNTISLPVIEGPDGIAAIYGADPADEAGSIASTIYSWPGPDYNGDGRPDSFAIRWSVDGNIGENSGYGIVFGSGETLSAETDTVLRAPNAYRGASSAYGTRHYIPVPDQVGTYRAKVCGWDRFRDQPTVCDEPITIEVVQSPAGPIVLYGDDPQDETGTIVAGLYGPGPDRNGDGRADSFQPKFTSTGNVGHRHGFVILHGFEAELTYGEAETTTVPRWTYPNGRWSVPMPNRGGLYHAKVCGWDPFREQPTVCSETIELTMAQGPNGVVAIYGDDPESESGSINVSMYGPGPDTDGDGLPNTFQTRFHSTGDVGSRHGFVILHGFDEALTYGVADMVSVPRWAYPSSRWRVPVPNRAGRYFAKVCGWDPFRERPTVCSENLAVPVINGANGVSIIFGDDPADEEGTITSELYSWPGADANRDGRPDTFYVSYRATGDLGRSSGFVILHGYGVNLSPDTDAVIHVPGHQRHTRRAIPVPDQDGVYRAQVCGWDRFREQTTICGDSVEIKVARGPRGAIVIYGDDPADETGAITATQYRWPGADSDGDGRPDTFAAAFNTQGTVGQSNGYVIIHGFSADPMFGHDEATFTPTWVHPGGRWSVPVPNEAGFYRVKVCGWDHFREQPTICSEVFEVIMADSPNGVIALYGDDPQNETGELTLTGVVAPEPIVTFPVNLRATGTLGQTSGYVVRHGTNLPLTSENTQTIRFDANQRSAALRGSLLVTVPTPANAGNHYVQACSWDHFREQPHNCSAPLTAKVVSTPRGLVTIPGLDPRDETGALSASARNGVIHWTRSGNIGHSGGFVIRHQGAEMMMSQEVARVSEATSRYDLRSVLLPDDNYAQVCAWDIYRLQTATCSNTTNVIVDRMQDGRPVLITDHDVRDEEGFISATLNVEPYGRRYGDRLWVEWDVEGDLGAESGFIILYSRQSNPTYPRDLVVRATADARTAEIPTRLHSADYHVRVCVWDENRQEAFNCSNEEVLRAMGNNSQSECMQRQNGRDQEAIYNAEIVSEEAIPVDLPLWRHPDLEGELSAHEAARFLTQSTFGPNLTDIQSLQAIGYQAWLEDQFNAPTSLTHEFLQNQPCSWTRIGDPWFKHALEGTDQLRQRVAFALSQILVVSNNGQTRYYNSRYYDLLARHAFSNFRDLLGHALRSPILNDYLNVTASSKANPETGSFPNEDLARELMQLFTIGLMHLNADGTPLLDQAGEPIPTYGEHDVFEVARSLTGRRLTGNGWGENHWFLNPMNVDEEAHDRGEKFILGVNVPAGLDGDTELDHVLDIMFSHPNVGPFIGSQLIQRLVTSNPTPEYVARVTAVFNDNGRGVRGDMAAVIQAILLDAEARNGHRTHADTFGKVREPMLMATALLRGMNTWSASGRYRGFNRPLNLTGLFNQAPLFASTVFNFFRPDHAPFALRDDGMLAPELELFDPRYAGDLTNTLANWTLTQHHDLPLRQMSWGMDFDEIRPFFENPDALVEQLNLIYLGGSMDDDLRSILVDVVMSVPGSAPRHERLTHALAMLVTTPDFAVQR